MGLVFACVVAVVLTIGYQLALEHRGVLTTNQHALLALGFWVALGCVFWQVR